MISKAFIILDRVRNTLFVKITWLIHDGIGRKQISDMENQKKLV